MNSNQHDNDKIEINDEKNEIWDESGEVEVVLYNEAKKEYDRLWLLFNDIEEKANRMLTRDIAFIALIFTGASFLASQRFNQVFWTILIIIMGVVAFFLSRGIYFSLKTQKVREFEMLTPDGIIDMAEEAPTAQKLYTWLNYELEKVGESFYLICKEKGDCLEKALTSESRAVIVTIIAVIFTIFGSFFLKE